jgi:hypothetical protein
MQSKRAPTAGRWSTYRPLISKFKASDPDVLALYIDDERKR